jgi:hypothetical protein
MNAIKRMGHGDKHVGGTFASIGPVRSRAPNASIIAAIGPRAKKKCLSAGGWNLRSGEPSVQADRRRGRASEPRTSPPAALRSTRHGGREGICPAPIGVPRAGGEGTLGKRPRVCLERVQIGDDVAHRQVLLFGHLGHSIDLLEGGDPTDHLQHAVGVKC